jgi:hypothetical protein
MQTFIEQISMLQQVLFPEQFSANSRNLLVLVYDRMSNPLLTLGWNKAKVYHDLQLYCSK